MNASFNAAIHWNVYSESSACSHLGLHCKLQRMTGLRTVDHCPGSSVAQLGCGPTYQGFLTISHYHAAMFKFAEIEKEEHEKKVLRDCRTLAAKKHVAEFANELDRIIEPMRIYFPDAEVKLHKSGLAVTLDLKYTSPKGIQEIFRLTVQVIHDRYEIGPHLGTCHGSLTAADLKHRFYGAYGKRIEGLFRQLMLERLEDD